MEIVSEEVGAVHASVPIEHSEVGRFLPVCCVLGLAEIQYDSYSVLVVLSHRTLIRGG